MSWRAIVKSSTYSEDVWTKKGGWYEDLPMAIYCVRCQGERFLDRSAGEDHVKSIFSSCLILQPAEVSFSPRSFARELLNERLHIGDDRTDKTIRYSVRYCDTYNVWNVNTSIVV